MPSCAVSAKRVHACIASLAEYSTEELMQLQRDSKVCAAYSLNAQIERSRCMFAEQAEFPVLQQSLFLAGFSVLDMPLTSLAFVGRLLPLQLNVQTLMVGMCSAKDQRAPGQLQPASFFRRVAGPDPLFEVELDSSYESGAG